MAFKESSMEVNRNFSIYEIKCFHCKLDCKIVIPNEMNPPIGLLDDIMLAVAEPDKCQHREISIIKFGEGRE